MSTRNARPTRRLVSALFAIGLALALTAPAAAADPFVSGRCMFETDPALRALPADTLLVLSASDPLGLADRLGRVQAEKDLGRFYGELVAEMKRDLGRSLLDPDDLRAIGVDPNATAGIAWLSAEHELGAFYFGLRDSARFQQFVIAEFGPRIREKFVAEPADGGAVLRVVDEDDAAFAVRGNVAYLVFGGRSGHRAVAASHQLLALPEDRSLARSPKLRAALDGLPFGRDGALYVETRGVMDFLLREIFRYEDPSYYHEPAAMPEFAPGNNAAIQLQQYMEEEKAQREQRIEQERKRYEAQRKLFDTLLGTDGPTLIGIEVRERDVLVRGRSRLVQGTLLHKALRPLGGPPTLLRALNAAPLLFGAAAIDMASYREMLDQMVRAEGLELDQFVSMVKMATGFDLDQDLFQLLDGTFQLAMTGDMEFDVDVEKLLEGFGGAIVLGVTDEAHARGVLARLAAFEPLKELFVRSKRKDQYEFAVPHWRTLLVSVRGGKLIISPQKKLADRVARGKAGRFLKKDRRKTMRALFLRDDLMGAGMVDWRVFAGVAFGVSRGLTLALADTEEHYSSGEPARVKAAIEELNRTERELRASYDERERAMVGLLEKVLAAVGPTAAVTTLSGDVLELRGGQFPTTRSLRAGIRAAVRAGVRLGEVSEDVDARTEKLYRRQEELRLEIQRLRARQGD